MNKILILDIETTPLKCYSWGPMYETNLIKVLKQSNILCFSAKWLDGEHITKGWVDYKGKWGDDKEIIKHIWNLLNEADIVVVQNGKAFDIKTIFSRFIFHGLAKPAPFKTIDTKIEAKKHLRLPSYSLDNMCEYFGIGKKMEHEGFSLWEKCLAGDVKAWKRMKKYNKQDVVITEKLYLKLRPYITTHPNLNLFNGTTDKCPNCGGNIQRRGFAISRVSRFQRFQCLDCGSWSQKPIKEGALVR